MQHLFISYRRGDSAGHAGRLFDRLKDQFGAERVFMDVTDLRPGQDFADELERAVARADCVLAVIGPRWLEARDAAGQRRIDDPDDFVRREIGAALAKQAAVIPVLVHGAAMPGADELPEPLRPLARRQAIRLSDERWDSDLRELIQLLSPRGPATATVPAPPGKRPMRTVAAVALALLAVSISVAAWWALRTTANQASPSVGSQAGNGSATAHAPLPATAAPPPSARTAPPQPRFTIALPPLSEVRFRTNRAQVVITLLAIRQEPRDADTQVLTFLVRMLNRGPSDEAFGSDQFRLVVGEQSFSPLDTLISAVQTTDAKEARLRFVVPSRAADVALDVHVNADSTRVPVSLAQRTPIADEKSLDDFGRAAPARVVDAVRDFPASLPAGQVVEVGKATYRLLAAVIERETVEKASLTLTVRCTAPRNSGGVSFGSSTVRLWVDGVPRAPLNFVNLAVDSTDSKEDRFVFDLVSMPQTLEVGILNSGDSARVPLALASLPRR